ncbi:MAG: hypothetical protein ACTHOH_17910 [Lysobacteraceae bacterium]
MNATPRPRIAFLTGQSDPGRCALSPAQRRMFDALASDAGDLDCVPLNFPWNPGTSPWRPVPLLRASLSNGRQYLAARQGALSPFTAHEIAAARDWLQTAPRTLLLVGSCGLSLLDALLAPMDADVRTRLRVVAYGAVAPRWPAHIAGVQLRGARDRIAHWFGPVHGPAPQRVPCGHMDYLDHAAVVDAARAQFGWLRGAA